MTRLIRSPFHSVNLRLIIQLHTAKMQYILIFTKLLFELIFVCLKNFGFIGNLEAREVFLLSSKQYLFAGSGAGLYPKGTILPLHV